MSRIRQTGSKRNGNGGAERKAARVPACEGHDPAGGGGRDASAERRVVAALRRIVHAIDTYSRQLLQECHVTAPQLVCLHALTEEGPLTSRMLADRVHLNPSTLVGIVDRLEAKGFVERCRDRADRRAVSLRMTERGLEFVRQAPSPLQAALTDKFKRLDEMNQSRLAEALEDVVHLMEADKFAPVPIMALPRYAPGRQAG